MPRLNVVEPSQTQGRVKEIFDGPMKGKHFNIFKAMANSPAALDFYVTTGGILSKGLLSARERETISLAVGEANGCHYCVAAHTALGKAAGLTEAQTLEARRGKVADPKLGALTRFTLTVMEKKGFVSEDEVKSFKAAGYSDGHAAEVVANIALNIYTNYFNHVNDTPVDFPAAPTL